MTEESHCSHVCTRKFAIRNFKLFNLKQGCRRIFMLDFFLSFSLPLAREKKDWLSVIREKFKFSNVTFDKELTDSPCNAEGWFRVVLCSHSTSSCFMIRFSIKILPEKYLSMGAETLLHSSLITQCFEWRIEPSLLYVSSFPHRYTISNSQSTRNIRVLPWTMVKNVLLIEKSFEQPHNFSQNSSPIHFLSFPQHTQLFNWKSKHFSSSHYSMLNGEECYLNSVRTWR